ncbi:MAG: DUF4382 domain-containing protein, partial [Chitinophagaceae bacterium]|nr:DUF4382 domain-containing protein [Chitinophagaceae bacterium]
MKRLLPILIGSLVMLMGCKKDVREDTQLRVYMGDGLRTIPFNAESVNIDIQGIKIRYKGPSGATGINSTNSEDWVWLNTRHGIHNLAELFSGSIQQLATGPVPGATIREIRFFIGKNNFIRMEGVNIPIQLPAGSEYGFSIALDKDLAVPFDSLTIDMNTAKSVQMLSGQKFAL